ncbi:MAG: hypothetical protein MHM6MM_001779 [Cercozoa sp. M6MM]
MFNDDLSWLFAILYTGTAVLAMAAVGKGKRIMPYQRVGESRRKLFHKLQDAGQTVPKQPVVDKEVWALRKTLDPHFTMPSPLKKMQLAKKIFKKHMRPE